MPSWPTDDLGSPTALDASSDSPATARSQLLSLFNKVKSILAFNPQAALGYAPVNKAGDTMSGALTVNAALAGSTLKVGDGTVITKITVSTAAPSGTLANGEIWIQAP